MKSDVYFDEIIVTSLIRYGDADCIARVFTREQGRLSLFCKNAFKPSKKRGSVLQVPARARGSFKLKSEGLSTLLELDIGSYTYALASSLRGFSLAAYACEISEIFVPEQDAVPLMFDLLDAFLRTASEQEISTQMLREFEFKLLELSGLLSEEELPETDPQKMAQVFAWHLRQHKQTPLKSMTFFRQI